MAPGRGQACGEAKCYVVSLPRKDKKRRTGSRGGGQREVTNSQGIRSILRSQIMGMTWRRVFHAWAPS